ncbi:MAG: hypothetical protein JWP78_3334 [Mucilaginibacter sp.]|nr:hypothetical protein [Mucilaginibacter sp.]
MYRNCNLVIQPRSNHYYALLPLHPVSAGCGFNNRAHRRIYFKLHPYPLSMDTGCDPRHTGYQ